MSDSFDARVGARDSERERLEFPGAAAGAAIRLGGGVGSSGAAAPSPRSFLRGGAVGRRGIF